MNQETKNYIRQWILKAGEDLIVIDKLTQFEVVAASAVCFHCQQVVEKYLKAFLIAHGVEIRKTHNIEFLLAECEEFDSDFGLIDPKDLNDFGVDIRYPGDIYSPTIEETLAHKQIALDVKALVEQKLQKLI
ncbi:MAG: HEPN domain-containing protein [Prolixibacteraceae bacterium]|jgi:HEPN domain-containing protein